MKRKQWSRNGGSGTLETTRWCTTVDTNLALLRSHKTLERAFPSERQELVDGTKWMLQTLEKLNKSTLKISTPSKTPGVDWRNWVGAKSSSRAQDAIAGAAWCWGWNDSGLRIEVNWKDRIQIQIISSWRRKFPCAGSLLRGQEAGTRGWRWSQYVSHSTFFLFTWIVFMPFLLLSCCD